MSNFTQAQLSAAFDTVKNQIHWKNPVNRIIKNPGAEQLACLEEAIVHFTGSIPSITTIGATNKIRVEAPGYYAMEDEMGCF